jgi:hypothetical protein
LFYILWAWVLGDRLESYGVAAIRDQAGVPDVPVSPPLQIPNHLICQTIANAKPEYSIWSDHHITSHPITSHRLYYNLLVYLASHRRADLQTALTQYIAAHYPSSEAVGSVFCSARSVVRKEVTRAEVQDQAVGLGGAENVEQERTEGDKKEVEDESKASGIATKQPEDKSDPDLPAEAEVGEGVVQKEDSTTVSDPAVGSGNIPAPPPNPASAEPTVSSVDPAADPSSATGTGTETSETGILAAANSAVAAVTETVETVKEALSAEVPVGGVAGLESEKPEEPKTETESGTDVARPDQEEVEETTAEAAEEPVQEAQQEEEEEDPSYTICIVSNKYNTNNFW